MTFYIVKRAYDEKGFAFRDRDRAEKLLETCERIYNEDYELIETNYVWHTELEAVETLDGVDIFGFFK